jgi:PIN domain nuclease of toxin-antitoxin system
MRFLLDTHPFLWFINENPELSNNAGELLESDIELMLSVASLWEIAIKISLKKLTLPAPYETFIPQQMTVNAIDLLPVTIEHLTVLSELPYHHRDPFDRLLIAQTISEKVQIISADTKFDLYDVNRYW